MYPVPESSARALFAARLIQARQMRGLSQRVVGDRMGLGKEKGSSRINRYEHQITAIGFDNLDTLADVLEVPAAYLLAESPTMADAILAVASASPKQQADLVLVLQRLSADPGLVKALLKVLKPSKHARAKIREALLALAAGGDSP